VPPHLGLVEHVDKIQREKGVEPVEGKGPEEGGRREAAKGPPCILAVCAAGRGCKSGCRGMALEEGTMEGGKHKGHRDGGNGQKERAVETERSHHESRQHGPDGKAELASDAKEAQGRRFPGAGERVDEAGAFAG